MKIIISNQSELPIYAQIREQIKEQILNGQIKEGEILQIQASAVEQVGSYHMPKAQNPVYIAVMQHPAKDDVEEINWLDS